MSDGSDHSSRPDSDGIGDLLTDAMEDSTPSPTNVAKSKVARNSRPHKMEVKISGESLVMEFDSDSDSEMAMIGKPASPSLLSPPGGGGVRGMASSSIFSDSDDDDFCIVHTPTSTKVVRNFLSIPDRAHWGSVQGSIVCLCCCENWCVSRHLGLNPRSSVC